MNLYLEKRKYQYKTSISEALGNKLIVPFSEYANSPAHHVSSLLNKHTAARHIQAHHLSADTRANKDHDQSQIFSQTSTMSQNQFIKV